jgi:hypothetical protein
MLVAGPVPDSGRVYQIAKRGPFQDAVIRATHVEFAHEKFVMLGGSGNKLTSNTKS